MTRILRELEESNFIRRYYAFNKKEKEHIYQLTDFYSLFYLNFIEKSNPDDEHYWIELSETATFFNWAGYAFEMVGLHHIPEIKKALGISGVRTAISSWQSSQAQIDLVIDRKDQVINLFEMKFSINTFTIDKKYDAVLRNKVDKFRQATKTKKALFLSLLTTYGLTPNQYSGMVQNDLTMDIFFE